MTRGNVRIQGWVFPLFSPDSDDRLSLNFHRFVILYRSCDTLSVGLGYYCLPKVCNGFKATHFFSLKLTIIIFVSFNGTGFKLKPLDPFGTAKKKVHRFTNNLQGLQKVMVKDFSWNIYPWNALLFEKTLK